jgi:CBS domain-containing protein
MSLIAQERLIHHDASAEHELVVACPQRIDPVSIRTCARCELCEGLELDGRVAVRCGVEPRDAVDGSPAPSAPITSIMTADVVSVDDDTAVENVQWLLVGRSIGAVPVLDRRRRPIGILAKTDLLRERDEPSVSAEVTHEMLDAAIDERALCGLTARDLMTPVVHAVLTRASIAATAALMAREHVHHVIVVDDLGALRGIVSSLDIVRWVAARDRFVPRRAA